MSEYDELDYFEKLDKIHSAIVYLDDDMPEYMEGLIRIGSVQFFDKNGTEIEDTELNNKLVDNREFHQEEQLINSVAKRLGISYANVTIEY